VADDFLTDLIDHKNRVGGYMRLVADELLRRACEHDNSKFSPSEFEAYESAFAGFQQHAFGTEEYKAVIEEIRPAVERHYAANDHHPEFFAGGVNDMNLVQIIEMVCDWIAASQRRHGDLGESLRINKARFTISDQLQRIIENTVEDLVDRKANSHADES
jgi:hypothetical protein